MRIKGLNTHRRYNPQNVRGEQQQQSVVNHNNNRREYSRHYIDTSRKHGSKTVRLSYDAWLRLTQYHLKNAKPGEPLEVTVSNLLDMATTVSASSTKEEESSAGQVFLTQETWNKMVDTIYEEIKPQLERIINTQKKTAVESAAASEEESS